MADNSIRGGVGEIPLQAGEVVLPATSMSVAAGRFWNALTSAVAAVFFGLMVYAEVQKLVAKLAHASLGAMDTTFVAALAASLAKLLFLALMASLFLLRKEPISKSSGIWPRITALAGTFLIFLVVLLPEPKPALAQNLAGLALNCIGGLLSALVIRHLGRSFSIMPEARKLVTSGPYAHIRHPLYLAEEVAILGVIVIYFSLPAVLLLVTHVALQIQRMKNEEAVLAKTFSEYQDYVARTHRVIPGVY